MPTVYDVARRELWPYLVSIPERTVRSLAAVAGGTSRLVTGTLLPKAVRGSLAYRLMYGEFEQFMINDVAQVHVDGVNPAQTTAITRDFADQKVVGTALERQALTSVYFSPLWVFAIVNDFAGGNTVFLTRLVVHLKRQGVIEPQAQPEDLVDVLDAMQRAAGRTEDVLLDRKDLSVMLNELKVSYGDLAARSETLLPKYELIWELSAAAADKNDVSVEQINGMMTLDLQRWLGKGASNAYALGQAGRALIGDQILDSYQRTLTNIAQNGATQHVVQQMQPYVRSAIKHYDPSALTWTEKQIRQRR